MSELEDRVQRVIKDVDRLVADLLMIRYELGDLRRRIFEEKGIYEPTYRPTRPSKKTS